ncbi:hypothetical protein QTP86_012522 [Hemibagrus guttatus]|nr:hypothetical protein QTP86_012522 [Hemibagrus guttatus]
MAPDPYAPSCGWWAYGKLGLRLFFGLCPAESRRQRLGHQALACVPQPQAWLQIVYTCHPSVCRHITDITFSPRVSHRNIVVSSLAPCVSHLNEAETPLAPFTGPLNETVTCSVPHIDLNETAYLEIRNLENYWCQRNNLLLNVSKTKELIVDFSTKQERNFQTPMINESPVERVDSFRYLSVHITQDLPWSCLINTVVKKARQRLYHLRLLRDFRLPSTYICCTFPVALIF